MKYKLKEMICLIIQYNKDKKFIKQINILIINIKEKIISNLKGINLLQIIQFQEKINNHNKLINLLQKIQFQEKINNHNK